MDKVRITPPAGALVELWRRWSEKAVSAITDSRLAPRTFSNPEFGEARGHGSSASDIGPLMLTRYGV